jgi:uncharacterized protein
MFRTIIFSAAAFLHIYVFWRAACTPAVTRRLSRKVLIGAGVFGWVGVLVGRLPGRGTGDLMPLLEMAGISWLVMLFLTAVCLLVVDLGTGFGLFFSRRAPALRGWALLAGGVLSVLAAVQGLRPPVIRDYAVHLPGLPAGMENTVLVAMSDLHLGPLHGVEWLEARAAQVRALQPDLVVLVGDLFEGHGEPRPELWPVFGRFGASLGVLAVAGNHDFHGRQQGLRLLEKAGVQVLRDRWLEIVPGLVLAGVDDLTVARRAGNQADLVTPALAGRPPGAAILLSHTPWQAEEAAAAGAGLMLSGHTHGGQVWPFGYVVRFFYPLLAGRYDVEGMTVIVCRGTGAWGTRMRLWQPAEILRITLHAAEL